MTYTRDRANTAGQMLLPWSPGRTCSTAKAAQMIGICQTTVREMLESGELRGVRIRPGVKNSPWRVFLESIHDHRRKIAAEYDIEIPEQSARSARGTR